VEMPEMNGYEAALKLQQNDAYGKIPIIFLSGRDDTTSEMFGLNLGAKDYIHKPIAGEQLLERIQKQLSRNE